MFTRSFLMESLLEYSDTVEIIGIFCWNIPTKRPPGIPTLRGKCWNMIPTFVENEGIRMLEYSNNCVLNSNPVWAQHTFFYCSLTAIILQSEHFENRWKILHCNLQTAI